MWEEVIPEICGRLEAAGIRYHADASSSLYVNGFKFNMDDFDVTVDWNEFERAFVVFSDLNPIKSCVKSPQRLQFSYMGHSIDVIAYESETGIGPESERCSVMFSGHRIWTKIPGFYLERMRKDHPIRSAALEYFGMVEN